MRPSPSPQGSPEKVEGEQRKRNMLDRANGQRCDSVFQLLEIYVVQYHGVCFDCFKHALSVRLAEEGRKSPSMVANWDWIERTNEL